MATPPAAATTPTPVALAVPGATQISTRTTNGATLYVANTDGFGVYIRRTADPNDKLKVWPDDTPMVVVGPDAQAGGTTWENVRDPDGEVGWVPARYLADHAAVVQDAQVEENSVLTFVGTPRYVPKASGGVVEGLVRNTAKDTRSGILRALLLDRSGNAVAVAGGLVDDVPPGGTGVYVLFTGQNATDVAGVAPQVVVSRVATDPARIVIQNVAVQPGPDGPLVVGTVRSVDNVPLTLALLAGYIGDPTNVVGTARGIVDELQPGQSAGFTLKPDDQIGAYNRVVVQIAAATIAGS